MRFVWFWGLLLAVKPHRCVLVMAGLGVLGLCWVWCIRHREPVYQGKSLSGWLRVYRRPIGAMAPGVSPEAAEAIRHIGTNALPFLVSWLQERQELPAWKQKVFSVVYRWKLGAPGREILLEWVAGRQLRAGRAFWGFVILGEAARSAVPDLERVAHGADRLSAAAAITALGYVGPEGLRPLLSMITNSAFPLRKEAMGSLSQMRYLGANAHPAIVLLIQSLGDPDLAPAAADGLGRLRLESEISVPALAQCMNSTNPQLRMWGALSLGRFGGSARAAVPGLVKTLDDPEADVRREATNALELVAPEVLGRR